MIDGQKFFDQPVENIIDDAIKKIPDTCGIVKKA